MKVFVEKEIETAHPYSNLVIALINEDWEMMTGWKAVPETGKVYFEKIEKSGRVIGYFIRHLTTNMIGMSNTNYAAYAGKGDNITIDI